MISNRKAYFAMACRAFND